MRSKEHRLVLGKVDYNKSGRRNCEAAITWEFSGGKFSMCAEIWNPRHTDIYCGGQCVDTVAALFPHNAKVQEMLAIWKEWHLNDMVAGSPAQEAHLRTVKYPGYPVDHFGWACAALEEAGLQPDPDYLHNGEPYSYGSAWLTREIPEEVAAKIHSWSQAV